MPPPTVEIMIHSVINGWVSVLVDKTKTDIDLTVTPQEAYGIRIEMMDMDEKIKED